MPVELYRSPEHQVAWASGWRRRSPASLLRRRIRPYEVPISYHAASRPPREEGKKITWKDGRRGGLWILGRERVRAGQVALPTPPPDGPGRLPVRVAPPCSPTPQAQQPVTPDPRPASPSPSGFPTSESPGRAAEVLEQACGEGRLTLEGVSSVRGRRRLGPPRTPTGVGRTPTRRSGAGASRSWVPPRRWKKIVNIFSSNQTPGSLAGCCGRCGVVQRLRRDRAGPAGRHSVRRGHSAPR